MCVPCFASTLKRMKIVFTSYMDAANPLDSMRRPQVRDVRQEGAEMAVNGALQPETKARAPA